MYGESERGVGGIGNSESPNDYLLLTALARFSTSIILALLCFLRIFSSEPYYTTIKNYPTEQVEELAREGRPRVRPLRRFKATGRAELLVYLFLRVVAPSPIFLQSTFFFDTFIFVPMSKQMKIRGK